MSTRADVGAGFAFWVTASSFSGIATFFLVSNSWMMGPEGTMPPVAASNFNPPSTPWTEPSSLCIFLKERFTLLILREGHLEMPYCLHILLRVVGHTTKQKQDKKLKF